MNTPKTTEQLHAMVADVRAALAVAQSAATRTILLRQNRSLNFDALVQASAGEDAVAKCAAAFIQAQTDLNLLLSAEWSQARAARDALVYPLLTELFGQPVPGTVHLQCMYSGQTIAEQVVGLEHIGIDDKDGISGTIKTANSTRSFAILYGQAHFMVDV